jgi:acyl-CoA synthetase (AMP-forming)/AMP-acid ligase II/thioesterase domain-containing protein/acyl carrier protein
LTLNPTLAADPLLAAFGRVGAVEGPADLTGNARTIGNAIAWWAAAGTESRAFVGGGSAPVTFSRLLACITGFAGQLADAGLGAEHRIGLLVPPGLPGGQLAVALASNATLVPINPALTPAEVLEFASCSGLHAIVVPRWLDSGSRSAVVERKITVFEAVMASDGTLVLELFTDPLSGPIPHRPVVASDVALLLRSSGTTGAPKLIPVTHGNLAAMAEKLGSDLWFKLTASDRAACTMPLHYAAGLKTSLLVPLMLGAGVAFPPPAQVFELAVWVDALEPTYLSVAPGALQRMVERMRASRREFDGSSLRFVMCAASYLPEETRVAAQAVLRVPVLEFYGLSEAGIMAANPVPPGKAKPGTVGVPAPGELLVVDEDRNPVANGTVGQIMICGPTLMPGYVGTESSNPDELKDGWLLTGDLGRLDPDGYLCIEGRLKEVINRGGEKVFPYEIEKAVLQHPAVLEAAAFGVPHPRLGESVAAAVVLKPGSTVTEREFKEFLGARLAGFKLPRRLCYPPGLPRGSSGKVLRRSLTEAYATLPREVVPAGRNYLLQLELRDLWERLLGTPDIGLDDDFFDKGGDSLLATELLMELEALAGKPYPQTELSTLTIRRMAEVLASDLPAGRHLMTQVKQGAGIPLFLCHGDYVERGIYAQKLAALLPGDQPVFLLHCYADRFVGSSVEEIAQVYLRQVLDAAPRTPVFIGGYCNGGIMAWHLAHLLRSAGVEVVELLLIETMSLNARPALGALPGIFDAASSLLPGRPGRVLREHGMRYVWYWMRRLGAFSYHALRKKIVERQKPRLRDEYAIADRKYFAFMSRYEPPPIDVCVTCFIADQGRHFDTDPKFWRRLAPSVSVVSAPGTHQGVLVAGRQALATGIAEVLDRATTRYLLHPAGPSSSVQEVALR